ncbi:acyl-CoA dehydrogenase family protein [Microbacterium terricola]|uniref:Glutaryl-CoA dehydrogenase n=1 Tax=Microbacterium terricola TaxID=344163 RepID=A0ABM8DW50_9MICO|nr:acyl-CoA dehydrogenase family protein [Microbacterium terricola]UYK39393.1 acyl-CoA dehydrogenase family protein [Microbacterium terricola]BDV29883.1 glutaryl-CoA dehydrogenase [Microbacterium terricola]
MTFTLSAPDRVETAPAELLDADFYAFQHQLTATEQRALAGIRRFLDTEVRPFADDHWERAESPRHLFPRFAELGLFGNAFPETALFENSSVFRGWVAMEISRADPSTATFIGVHSGLAMTSIAVGGSPAQKAEWMPRLAAGELVAAFGLTEPGHGSDTARGLETTAERRIRQDGTDEWVLNGSKRWIGNGAFADLVVIWARDVADDQVKGFLVRTPTPGFVGTKIERKQSLRAVENADIVLQDVVVPESDRLPKIHGFRDVAVVLRLTRADVAWQALGVGVGAYEAALAYAKARVQFGKPIASFQLVQQKLADALAGITASIALCMRVSQMQDEGTQRDHHSAMAKAFVSARMRETVALCREICGGNGIQLGSEAQYDGQIVPGYSVARYFADAEAVFTFEGTFDMNSLIVGRAITGIAAFV